jgi:hypothetical protein
VDGEEDKGRWTRGRIRDGGRGGGQRTVDWGEDNGLWTERRIRDVGLGGG